MYGGSNVGNLGGVTAENVKFHNQPHSAEFSLPPLSIIVFKPEL
jgi:1,4-alpha-glucan branching enzyme